MKVNSTIYKGIEYIQVNTLPPEQKERLLQTINQELFIKILVDEKLIGNCLLFKDYEIWFENIYKAQSRTITEQGVNENIEASEPIEQLRNPEA
jgi:hypothetical protein